MVFLFKEVYMTNKKNNENLTLEQLSKLTGLKVPTLNARVKTLFCDKDLVRGKTNKFLLTPDQTKKVVSEHLHDLSGKIIYIGNLKGGVGKTTIAYLLADILSSLGYKTCAIDLDVQSNLTLQFIDVAADQLVFCDLIDNKVTIKDLIVKVSSTLDIIPSSLKNSIIQKSLSTQSPKHYLTWFNSLCLTHLRSKYDVIIVDTPPSLTTLNSVFCLCLKNNDNIIIPACADEFSLVGIGMVLDDIAAIRKSYKAISKPKTSIIMNRFIQHQTLNLEIFLKMNNNYKEYLSKTIIKDLAKIREVVAHRLPLVEVGKSSEIFEILTSLLKELNILKTTD